MGAYTQGHISQGLITGGLINGGLISGAFIWVLYPGGFYPGGLRSTLIIFKDSTCFTRTERGHAFAANKRQSFVS